MNMSRLSLFIPLILFIVLGVLFWSVLNEEDYDPQHLPSALIDQPMPAFDLPRLDGSRINQRNLMGKPYLLNVWATWCISCRVEHPFLVELSQQDVYIIGMNYKDDVSKAQKWLDDLGNPYLVNIVDTEGSLGLDLGVYGAPETYFVDAAGVIRYKHVGVIDQALWQDRLGAIYQEISKP